MTLTNNHRALILGAMRRKGITQKQIADTAGYGKAWATKMLNGTLKAINDETVDKLEELLGIQFVSGVYKEQKVSGLALRISTAIDENPQLGKVIEELLPLVDQDHRFTPRYFETKEMTKLGQEIIRLVFANEDKPGKVAREVLKLVSE